MTAPFHIGFSKAVSDTVLIGRGPLEGSLLHGGIKPHCINSEALPWLIRWLNKDYAVGTLGYYHKVKVGDTLHHIFELVDKENTLHFRLNLDTSSLHWTLEAVHDGLAH